MRSDLPPAPPAIAALPCDARGFPIPWFVHIDEQGVADFRIIGRGKLQQAIQHQLCWICGQKLRRIKAYVIGPMCAVNRVSAEPPSHPECATFAATACPFLTRPMAKRNERDMPEERIDPAGIMIARNPGVTAIWWSNRTNPFQVGNGLLFNVGPPLRVQWFAHGRAATRTEILDSIESGLPALQAVAELEGNGAVEDLAKAHQKAMALVPTA